MLAFITVVLLASVVAGLVAVAFRLRLDKLALESEVEDLEIAVSGYRKGLR
jgi:hypothetical protein